MAKQRQIQHRPDREKVRGQELLTARQEIKQLKRLVSRQQKAIRKLEDERGIPTEVIEPIAEAPVGQEDVCPKCSANSWTIFTTPAGKVIRGCKNCKARS